MGGGRWIEGEVGGGGRGGGGEWSNGNHLIMFPWKLYYKFPWKPHYKFPWKLYYKFPWKPYYKFTWKFLNFEILKFLTLYRGPQERSSGFYY